MKAIFLLKENKKTIERHIVRIPEVHEENFSKDVKSLTKFENDEKERVLKHKSIPQEKIAIMYDYEEWLEEQEATRDRIINLYLFHQKYKLVLILGILLMQLRKQVLQHM